MDETQDKPDTSECLFGQDLIEKCERDGWARGALIKPGEPIHLCINNSDGTVTHEVLENNYPDWTWEDRMRLLREQFGDEIEPDAFDS